MSSDNSVMRVRLASYLQRLRAGERRKPKEQRLSVPTLKELSEVAGVDPSSISRMANGRMRSLNLDVVTAILSEMWKRGFKTDIKDILHLEDPNDLKRDQNGTNDPWAPLPPLPPPLTRDQHRKYPGEEFVRAYLDEEDFLDDQDCRPEMLPEVAEVMRMLTKFPDPIQKDAAEALKVQLELVQKTLSFQDESLPK